MVGDKFDLNLPIFKHWNKVFGKYNYQLVNSRYSSSRYFEYCVCILPIDKEDEFYVSYEEDELRCYNKLQLVEFDNYENLIIKIGKDVCS